MSLHKSRASSVQLSNQQSLLKQKLSTIDKHIRRSENLPDTFFMHPQLLEYVLRQPTVQQTNNQLLLRAPRSFLFHERQAVKFYFISTAITDDRRYVLKVQPSHIKLEVYVQVDGRKKVCYLVEKERGILIDQMDWKKAQFVLVALTKQKLSTVKVQMDTIIVEHKVKIHGIPSQRKIVEKELDQYLKKNVTKQKVAQILQKRKRKSMMLSRNSSSRAKTSAGYSNTKAVELHQTSRIFRSTSGFNESTSLIRSTSAVVKQPKIQQTQLKRDFNVFEQSKQKYLKHLQKMNPRAAQQIYENQKKYRLSKQQTLESVSSTAIGLIFMFRMLKLSIKVSKDRVRQIHVELLCKKFMRNLMHANKIRMAIRSRNQVSMGLNLSAIASMMWRESKKKAQERIMSRFKVQLFMLDISKACTECENYIQKVITVQRKFRKDNIRYKMRFKQMSQAKGHTFEDQQHFNRLFEKYKKYCYTKSKKLKFGFTKFHTKIDELVLVKQ